MLVVLFFSSYAATCQVPGIKDLINVYSTDNATIRQFCSNNGFVIINNSEDEQSYLYVIAPQNNKAVQMYVSYKKDSCSCKTMVTYRINKRKEFEIFRKSVKNNGYKRKRRRQIKIAYPSYGKQYVKENLQIDLIQRGGSTHLICIHNVCDVKPIPPNVQH